MASDLTPVTVWVGEWPLLKQFVGRARAGSTNAWEAALSKGSREAITAVTVASSRVDEAVTSQSRRISAYCFANPWLQPAALVGVATAVTTSKSLRWGTAPAMRNGILVGGLTAAYCFPNDIRSFVDKAYHGSVRDA